MAIPKYVEDNCEILLTYHIDNYGPWSEEVPASEEYIPYAIRYQLYD